MVEKCLDHLPPREQMADEYPVQNIPPRSLEVKP
jgi:hypothetical protein